MDVLKAILSRRSVRAYDPRPIPPEVRARLEQALRAAPSACNLQPWRFIFVTHAETRQKLARAAHDQMWMATAPLTVVACALPQQAYPRMGALGNSAVIDVTIAVDHLTLAAVAEGLGTCWIGAFDEPPIKRLLDIPADVAIVALMPVGYPAQATLNHPLDERRRKPHAEVFCVDKWHPQQTASPAGGNS